MSEQPSPTSPTNSSEKAEIGGINLLIGFVVGAALQFGWWALLDRLSLRTIDPANASFPAQILAVSGQSNIAGFLIGATLGATANVAHAPVRSVVGKSIRWAFGFALAYFGLDVMRFLLQAALGKEIGDIVTSAILFGLAGAFAGVIMELQRTVAPHIGSAVLSIRQIARWTLKMNRAARSRVFIAALLGALIGITIEMLLQRLPLWPLMLVPIAVVAVMAYRIWRPSQKTMRQWLSGVLIAIIIFDLLALLALNAMLGTLAGIVMLVGYAILQSRNR